jgi:hypothetical protein
MGRSNVHFSQDYQECVAHYNLLIFLQLCVVAKKPHPLLFAVFGDNVERSAVDPEVATAQLD